MNKFLLVCCVAAVLVGCGSSVPLNDVPVADATVKSVSGSGAGADASSVQGTGVTPVELGKDATPANAASASDTIYFDYDSFVIKPEFQSVIAAHARKIKSQPARKVAIEGHTDETGGREYNLALGQKRADAVRDALAILGISQNQMESVSFGEEKPVVPGADEAAYSKNRRAAIRYL